MAGSMVGGATSRVLGGIGRAVGVAAALGGGFTAADSFRSGIEEEKTAGVIFRGANQRGGFTDQKEVQQLARQTAIATGGTSMDILGGLDMFVRKTGDLGVAKDMLNELAKQAAATGTNFADMGNTAAEVYNQLKDPVKTLEVMRALEGQGRAGAIDIKDLGQYGGRLASGAAQFTGSLSSNIESFGAIAQLAKKLGGATDTAEATESVVRLGSDMAKHADRFAGMGINVFADKGHTKFRNAEDVITESVVKTKGDVGALHELFGERSVRAVTGAQVAYANAGGGASGEAAIRREFADLHATTLKQEEIDADAKKRLAEIDAKLNIATEQFHQVLNDKLLPLMPGLIDKFTALVPTLEKVLQFLVDNPWKGIGALVTGAIVAEIAKAGMGVAVGAGITALMTRVLKMLGGDKLATASMSVAAGVVNVTSGGGVPTPNGILTPKGKVPVGELGEIAEGVGGSLATGLGMLGAGGAALAYLTYRQGKREEAGGKSAADLLAEGTGGSAEERQGRLGRAQALIGRIEAEEAAADKFRKTGAHTTSDDKAIADLEARGAAKSLQQLKDEAEQLKKTLGDLGSATSALEQNRPQPQWPPIQ